MLMFKVRKYIGDSGSHGHVQPRSCMNQTPPATQIVCERCNPTFVMQSLDGSIAEWTPAGYLRIIRPNEPCKPERTNRSSGNLSFPVGVCRIW